MGSIQSKRQIEVLRFIHKTLENKNYPPTVREIGEEVGLNSTSTVHGHLKRLEKRGFILRNPDKPRVLNVTESGIRELGLPPKKIPLLGKIAAGEPILDFKDATDFFPTPPYLQQVGAPLFMLMFSGESMINIGIIGGDLVIVRKQENASNGDVVVALNEEGEATCKRFYREKDCYRLQPENDNLNPSFLKKIIILGKVISLYRDNII